MWVCKATTENKVVNMSLSSEDRMNSFVQHFTKLGYEVVVGFEKVKSVSLKATLGEERLTKNQVNGFTPFGE